jgi:hypothetical protein
MEFFKKSYFRHFEMLFFFFQRCKVKNSWHIVHLLRKISAKIPEGTYLMIDVDICAGQLEWENWTSS